MASRPFSLCVIGLWGLSASALVCQEKSCVPSFLKVVLPEQGAPDEQDGGVLAFLSTCLKMLRL